MNYKNIANKVIYMLNLLILFQANAIAQLDEIEFENYSTADGLGAAWYLTHIVQDQDGYLWLSSLDGLIRFTVMNLKFISLIWRIVPH